MKKTLTFAALGLLQALTQQAATLPPAPLAPASTGSSFAAALAIPPRIKTGIPFANHGPGKTSFLSVYRPAQGTGPWPVIIFFPGGGWKTQSETTISPMWVDFTSSGYAVVSADYISSDVAKWPAQIQDAKAAVRWVRANAVTYGFDPARIAVAGESSGGHMATYVGVTGGVGRARVGATVVDLVGTVGGNLEQSDSVQAVAPFFGPSDLLMMDHYSTPLLPDHNAVNSPESSLIGAEIQLMPELAATANPLIHLRAGLPPFWITQGAADGVVPFNQSELLNAALVRAGQATTFWPVLDGGHGPGVSSSPEVFFLLKRFFDRTLMSGTLPELPLPRFTATALAGVAPLTVSFDASTSTAPAGAITKYTWSSGDNSGGEGQTLNHTYVQAGVYPVTLSVSDTQGGSASVTTQIVVSPPGTAGSTPPSVTLTGPLNAMWYARTGDLLLQATANAGEGASIASVEFFVNDQLVAWDNTVPFLATLGRMPPGSYTAYARASDSSGRATLSAPVGFRVFAETETAEAPTFVNEQFGLSYYRVADNTVSYVFERSDDLASWTEFTPTESLLTDGVQVQHRQALDPISMTGVPRRFIRIKITPTP